VAYADLLARVGGC